MNKTYEKPKNFFDLVKILIDLDNKVYNLKNETCKNLKLDLRRTQDARILFLNSVQQSILHLKAHLNFYLDARIRYKDNQQKIYELFDIAILNPNYDSIGVREEIIFDEDRKNFINWVYISLDAFLYNLCSKLDLKDSKNKNISYRNQSYSQKINAVLDRLEIKIKDKEQEGKLLINEKNKNSFLCLAHLRDSYHNNGIHQKNQEQFYIDETEYLFIKGKKVECSGWHEIFNLLYSVLYYLSKIVEHDLIKSIQYIEDDSAILYEENSSNDSSSKHKTINHYT